MEKYIILKEKITMKPINNFETVQATTGEFKRPTPNGYICKITFADDYPFDANTGKGDYLKIEYDIASGELGGNNVPFIQGKGSWYV